MKSTVAVVRVHPQASGPSLLKGVKEAVTLLGGLETFSRRGGQVLVKPNIASPDVFSCTSPSVTWAVVKMFSEFGCEVLIGEDPAIPTPEDFAYREYGLYDLPEETNIKVISLRKGPHTKVKMPEGGFFQEIEISRHALEADLVVSVAVMKSANVVTATLGVKNMKGVVPPSWKRKFHCEGLNQGIVDLISVMKPGLVIIDGTFGKDWSEGVCFPVGLLIASGDPVAADAVCATIMGFEPEGIEHIKLARDAGLGEIDLKKITIKGEKITGLVGKFRFSPPKNPFHIAAQSAGKIEIIQGNPCSVCLNHLGQVLAAYEDRMREFGELSILVGPVADPARVSDKRQVVLFGSCLKKHAARGNFLHGCPPTDYEAAQTGSLKKLLDDNLQRAQSKKQSELRGGGS